MQGQVPLKQGMNLATVLWASVDRGQPVTGQNTAVGCQAGHGLFDDLLPMGRIQVVADLAQDDQIEAPVRPVIRQSSLLDNRVGYIAQTFPGQLDRCRVQVLAEQGFSAAGQRGAKLAVGTGRLEDPMVKLPRQAGEDQVTLAPLVPAGAKPPRIVADGK